MSGFVLHLQELVLSPLGHDYQSWPGGWLGLESRCVSPLHYPPKMTYTKSPWLDKTAPAAEHTGTAGFPVPWKMPHIAENCHHGQGLGFCVTDSISITGYSNYQAGGGNKQHER